MKFEWDDTKALKNLKKHYISFDQAALIFSDPYVMTIPDTDHSAQEEREISLGLIPDGSSLVVIHTTRIRLESEFIRIISARKADKSEELSYYLRRSLYEKTL